MNEQDLEKMKNEIKDYPIEIVISIWDLSLQEIERRIKKK